MNDTDASGPADGSMDTRRKRMLFRSWHRGTREMDMLLGKFAEQHIGTFTDQQLDRFDGILAENDLDIYNWLSGRAPVPEDLRHDVMGLLRNFTLSVRHY
jgi:antitoxin CptB